MGSGGGGYWALKRWRVQKSPWRDFLRQREESATSSDHFQPHFPPWGRPVLGKKKFWKVYKNDSDI